jgi:RimJ/RimL family protein N-acetyltransferase
MGLTRGAARGLFTDGERNMTHTLTTLRLVLRDWRDSDLDAYAALNADPDVRKHFGSALTPAQSDEEASRIRAHFAARDYGYFAVEVPGIADFIGFVGLMHGRYDIPGFGLNWIDLGWRLARPHWGRGYAGEAAQAVTDFAFRELKLPELTAHTVPGNKRSRRVMERLGMTHDARDDFDHPHIADGHPLKPHLLYRLNPEQHYAANAAKSL